VSSLRLGHHALSPRDQLVADEALICRAEQPGRPMKGKPINRAAEGDSFVCIRTVASVTPFSRDGRESVVRSYRCRTPTCGGD
jgi:hypothetical protein